MKMPMRASIGFVVLFATGYEFVSTICPGKTNWIECSALSTGYQHCIVVFMGLGLNYNSVGCQVEPDTLSISSFIMAFVAITAYRRSRCEIEDGSKPNELNVQDNSSLNTNIIVKLMDAM
jgi:uncharacterized membrane protein